MSVICCDASMLPTASRDAKRTIMFPNPITIPAVTADAPVTRLPFLKHPAFFYPLQVATGELLAFPARMQKANPNATFIADEEMCAYKTPGGYGAIMPFPGEWAIMNRGSTAVSGLILDASSPMAQEMMEQLRGTHAVATFSTLGVTAATQNALAANPFALHRMLINDSVNVIWLMEGADAVANTGIRLNPGGVYSTSARQGDLFKGRIAAISDVAGPSNLLIKEGGHPIPT